MSKIEKLIYYFNLTQEILDDIGISSEQLFYLVNLASDEERPLHADDFIALRDHAYSEMKKLNLAVKEYQDAKLHLVVPWKEDEKVANCK